MFRYECIGFDRDLAPAPRPAQPAATPCAFDNPRCHEDHHRFGDPPPPTPLPERTGSDRRPAHANILPPPVRAPACRRRHRERFGRQRIYRGIDLQLHRRFDDCEIAMTPAELDKLRRGRLSRLAQANLHHHFIGLQIDRVGPEKKSLPIDHPPPTDTLRDDHAIKCGQDRGYSAAGSAWAMLPPMVPRAAHLGMTDKADGFGQ